MKRNIAVLAIAETSISISLFNYNNKTCSNKYVYNTFQTSILGLSK